MGQLKTGYPGGVPLGGIGTGWIELLKTGKPGAAVVNNNWAHPLLELRGCFFALRVELPDGKSFFRLLQENSIDEFQCANSVRYSGKYPVAKAEYFCSDLPMKMEVEAFSPLVPHDVDNSNIPGVVFIFRFKNLFRHKAAVNLYVSWDNILGCGGPHEDKLFTNRTGNRIETLQTNSAAGLCFKSSSDICDVYPNTVGEYALMTGCDDRIRQSFSIWNNIDSQVELLKALEADVPYGQELLQGIEGVVHPAGILRLETILDPMQEWEIPVVLSWYTPHHCVLDKKAAASGKELNLYAPQYKPEEDQQTEYDRNPDQNIGSDIIIADYGHFYENRYKSAVEVAEKLLSEYKKLFKQTKELHDFLYISDLPQWLVSKIINDSVPLTTNTILTKKGILTTLEASRGMSGALGTMDQRLVAHAAYQLFYPDINRSELELFASLQGKDGHIPHFCGNVHENIGSSFVEYGDTLWPDLSCSFIIQCYRDLLNTGNFNFFNEMLPHISRAYEWLKSADRDGDGVPEGGTTWDIEFYNGLFVYTGTVWLATLRVIEKIAELTCDDRLHTEAAELFDNAQDTIISELWNGRYFNKVLDRSSGAVSDDIFIGQLAGEWIVRLLGLKSILPCEMLEKTIRIIYENNGNTELYRLPPNQVKSDGTLVERDYCEHSWPQYAMVFQDCLALYLGMVDESISSIRNFDRVVNEIAGTPWATTLWYDCRTGLPAWDKVDRYMNCTAAWFIFNALAGFHDDRVEELLIIGPSAGISSSFKKLPLISTLYWAMSEIAEMDYETNINIRFFKVFGTEIQIRGIKLRGEQNIYSCMVNNCERNIKVDYEDGYSRLDFICDDNICLKEGDVISVNYSRIG